MPWKSLTRTHVMWWWTLPTLSVTTTSLNLWDMSSSTAQPIHERCQGANLTLFSKDSENLVAIKMDHHVVVWGSLLSPSLSPTASRHYISHVIVGRLRVDNSICHVCIRYNILIITNIARDFPCSVCVEGDIRAGLCVYCVNGCDSRGTGSARSYRGGWRWQRKYKNEGFIASWLSRLTVCIGVLSTYHVIWNMIHVCPLAS